MWTLRRRVLVGSVRFASAHRPVGGRSKLLSILASKPSNNRINYMGNYSPLSHFATSAIMGAELDDNLNLTPEAQAFFTVLEKVARRGDVDKLMIMICEEAPVHISLSIPKVVSIMEMNDQWDLLIILIEALASNGALNEISLLAIEEAAIRCRNERKAAAIVEILAKYNLDPSSRLVREVSRALGQARMLKELLIMVDTLRNHKYHPSVEIYHNMLGLCQRGGHWQVAIQIFDVMDATTGRQMTQLAYEMILQTLYEAKQHKTIVAVIENLNKRCLRRHALEAETELALGDVNGALETVIDAHRMSVNAGENVYIDLMERLAKDGMLDELETLVISTIYQSRGDLKSWSRAARMWRAVGEESRAQMVVVDMIRFGVDPWQMCYKTALGLERVHLREGKEEAWAVLDTLNAQGKLQTLPGLLSAVACLVETNGIDKALEIFDANVSGAILHTNAIMAADPSYTGAYASLSNRNTQTLKQSKTKIRVGGAGAAAGGGGSESSGNSNTGGNNTAGIAKPRKFLWMKRMPPRSQNARPEAARFDLGDLPDPSLRELWMRVLGELLHLAKKVGQGNYSRTKKVIEKYFTDRSLSIGMYHEAFLQLLTYRNRSGRNEENIEKIVDLVKNPPADAPSVPWTTHYNLAMSACLLSGKPEKVAVLYQHMTDKSDNRTVCTSALLDCEPNVRTHKSLLEALDLMKKEDEILALAKRTATDIVNREHMAGSLHEDLAPEEEWRRKRQNFVVINLLERGFNIAVDRVLDLSETQMRKMDPKEVEANVEAAYVLFSAIVEVGFKLARDDYDRMVRALLRGSAVLGPESDALLKASEVFGQSMHGHRPFGHQTAGAMLDAALKSRNEELVIEVWDAAPDSFVLLAASPLQIKEVAKILYKRKHYKPVVELFVNCARMRETIASTVLSDTLLWRLFVSSFLHQASKGATAVSETPIHSGVHKGEHPSLETVDVLAEFHSTASEFHPKTEGPLGDKHGPLADFYFALEGASDLRLLLKAGIPVTILEQLMVVGLGEPALIVLEKLATDREMLLKPATRYGDKANSLATVCPGKFFSAPEERAKFDNLLERLAQVLAIEDGRRLAEKKGTAAAHEDGKGKQRKSKGKGSSSDEPDTLLERFKTTKLKLFSTI